MDRVFGEIPFVLDQTVEIAERCSLKLQQVSESISGVRRASRIHDRYVLCEGCARWIPGAARVSQTAGGPRRLEESDCGV